MHVLHRRDFKRMKPKQRKPMLVYLITIQSQRLPSWGLYPNYFTSFKAKPRPPNNCCPILLRLPWPGQRFVRCVRCIRKKNWKAQWWGWHRRIRLIVVWIRQQSQGHRVCKGAIVTATDRTEHINHIMDHARPLSLTLHCSQALQVFQVPALFTGASEATQGAKAWPGTSHWKKSRRNEAVPFGAEMRISENGATFTSLPNGLGKLDGSRGP